MTPSRYGPPQYCSHLHLPSAGICSLLKFVSKWWGTPTVQDMGEYFLNDKEIFFFLSLFQCKMQSPVKDSAFTAQKEDIDPSQDQASTADCWEWQTCSSISIKSSLITLLYNQVVIMSYGSNCNYLSISILFQ